MPEKAMGKKRVPLRDGRDKINKITLISLMRNAEIYLDKASKMIASLENYYECEFDYVFLENDSHDDTPGMLRRFLVGRKGTIIVPDGTEALASLDRVQRITVLRNLLMGMARPLTSDWTIMIDDHIYFDYGILEKMFSLEPLKRNIGMLTAFGVMSEVTENGRARSNNHYYDTSAFVTVDGESFWPRCRFEKCVICGTPEPLQIKKIPLLPVLSAFGGFALIKTEILNHPDVYWHTLSQGGRFICEHIHFCEKMRNLTGYDVAVACEAQVYWEYAKKDYA